MTTPYPNQLCRPIDPYSKQDIAWTKDFSPHYSISLRPVSLSNENDLDTVSSWIEQGYAAQQPVDQLRVMYIIIAESSYTQSFMVLLDHEIPVCQVDIYEVSQDVLKEHYSAREGDYRLHVPVIPLMESYSGFPIHAIQTCLDYFFSFPEVKRVLWTIHTGDATSIAVALQAGFQLLHTFNDNLGEEEKEMNVYCFGE